MTRRKEHANAWLDTHSGQMWNRLQGLVTFGETFLNLYEQLYDAAQNLGTQDSFAPNQIKALVDSLEALQSLAGVQHKATNACYAELTAYRKLVSADFSTFQTDYDHANSVLGGTEGEIAKLKTKIASETDAMSRDLAIIASGATLAGTGIIVVCCGALLEFEIAGASTGIIVAGIAMVSGGAAMTGIGAADYDAKLKAAAADRQKLQDDNTEIQMLTSLKSQLTSVDKTLSQAESALSNLVTSWQQLQNGIDAVITDLQNPEEYLTSLRKDNPGANPKTVSTIISSEIKTAAQDWEATVQIAGSLLAKGRNIAYVTTSGLPTQEAIAKAAQESGHPLAQRRLTLAV